MSSIPDDPKALKRELERLRQQLREIERARKLPPTRDELAHALGVNLCTISRWRAQGLAADATPEQAAKWRAKRCNTLQHLSNRKKHQTIKK